MSDVKHSGMKLHAEGQENATRAVYGLGKG
nr:MAG TPA: hypothetical protein [Caudoviricetes sp.]